MEQLHYNLLYRWFVGLGVDDPVWVPTVFTKNRDRLLEAEVARKFLAELLAHKEVRALLSDEHFSVDGTQVAAWASLKSFEAKDGSMNHRPLAAMASGIFTASGAAMRRTPRQRTPRPSSTRRAKASSTALSSLTNALLIQGT